MLTKTLLIEPSSVNFGNVQVGSIAIHKLLLINLNSSSVTFHLKATSSNNSRDFNLIDLSQNTLRPFEHRQLTVAFSPIAGGNRTHSWALRAETSSGEAFEQTINLEGRGDPAVRNTLRGVSLPPQEGQKEGYHYMLTVSNQDYLDMLEAHGALIDWYAAVPSGSRRGEVQETTIPKPGEVLLPGDISSLDGYGILHCFDVQTVKTKWLTHIHNTITNEQILTEVDEAIRHTTVACKRREERCRHELTEGRLKEYMDTAPVTGDIFKFTHGFQEHFGVVISSPLLTAFYLKIFEKSNRKRRMALVVRAKLARSTQKTKNFGVRTSIIPGIGPLWVPCYTATIKCLDDIPDPKTENNYQVRFEKKTLSTQDIKAIQERVRLYLGVER